MLVETAYIYRFLLLNFRRRNCESELPCERETPQRHGAHVPIGLASVIGARVRLGAVWIGAMSVAEAGRVCEQDGLHVLLYPNTSPIFPW